MSDFQFMPFFWADFLADTTHLNGIESGVYAMLLGNMWLRGGWIPDDDQAIARMCRIDEQTWLLMKPKIRPFLKLRNGRFSQRRLLDEFQKAKKIHQKNCKKTAKARQAKSEKKQQHASVTDSLTGDTRVSRDNYNGTRDNTFPSGNVGGAWRRPARERAKPPQLDLSSYLMNELRQMRENGHDQSTSDSDIQYLDDSNRRAENAGAHPARQTAHAKPH
jgi:uncharacterized protein YdaU (DUF1376 family)